MTNTTRWFRTVAPPWQAWLGYIVLLAIAGLALQDRSNRGLWIIVLNLVAAAYGVYRIVCFHPANRRDYQTWLRSTPWRHPMRLPFGPVHLVLQDVLILSILCATALCYKSANARIDTLPWAHGYPSVHFSTAFSAVFYCVMLPFLVAYLIIAALTIAGTGQGLFAYAIAFGLGLAVFLITSPWWGAAALLATYAVAYLGVQRSLAAFPWPEPAAGTLPSLFTTDERRRSVIGWPYLQLSPRCSHWLAPSNTYRWFAPMAGWWLYAVLAHFEFVWKLEGGPQSVAKAWVMYRTFIFVLASCRLLVYCVNRWAPISLLGRVTTGSWIIPGYDQVFITPLTTIVVGLTLEFVLRYFGVELHLALPLAVTVALWLIVSLGPSLDAWHLTGSHRLMRW